MRITYFGRFNGQYPERHISKALKKKHQVIEIDVEKGDVRELVKQANKSDMLLFHNAGMDLGIEQDIGKLPFYMGLSGLYQLLEKIPCKKVMWYLDRVVGFGEEYMATILPSVDYAFLNDDTWVRRHTWENIYCLHEGTHKRELGKYREDLACDVAFIGKVYGGRQEIISKLKLALGKKFRMFDGKDFDDICQSAKIVFVPKWGMNDFYWDNDVYRVLSSGGFLLHPRLHGLKESGVDEGAHFVGYSLEEELGAALDFFLKPENAEKRKQVAQQGRDYVLSFHTWDKRVEQMLSVIKDNLAKSNAS